MNKKKIGLFKDELGKKNMTEFVALRVKTYSELMDDDKEKEKAKRTKKSVIKRGLSFNNYKDFNLNSKVILKSQQRFKIEKHNAYTKKINKIARGNDDKRLQTFDRITTYPYGKMLLKCVKVRY